MRTYFSVKAFSETFLAFYYVFKYSKSKRSLEISQKIVEFLLSQKYSKSIHDMKDWIRTPEPIIVDLQKISLSLLPKNGVRSSTRDGFGPKFESYKKKIPFLFGISIQNG